MDFQILGNTSPDCDEKEDDGGGEPVQDTAPFLLWFVPEIASPSRPGRGTLEIIKAFCEELPRLWDKPGVLACIAPGLFSDPPERGCV